MVRATGRRKFDGDMVREVGELEGRRIDEKMVYYLASGVELGISDLARFGKVVGD